MRGNVSFGCGYDEKSRSWISSKRTQPVGYLLKTVLNQMSKHKTETFTNHSHSLISEGWIGHLCTRDSPRQWGDGGEQDRQDFPSGSDERRRLTSKHIDSDCNKLTWEIHWIVNRVGGVGRHATLTQTGQERRPQRRGDVWVKTEERSQPC